MGLVSLKRKFLIAVVGLLLLVTFCVPNDRGSENSAPPDTERKVEPAPTAQTEEAKSHARAVLLAGMMGKVMLTRPDSAKENPIVVNTPIQEGFQLSSSANSSAIVEFEHDSTVIIGQHSKLLFHQLALDAHGTRLTGMTFEKGVASFHFQPQHHLPSSRDQKRTTTAHADIYEIKTAEIRVMAEGKCRFRVDVMGHHVRVEVFNGRLHFASPVQSIELTTGECLEHLIGDNDTAFNIRKGIVKDPWDHWAATQEQLVLSESTNASKKNREPDDLRTILKLRRSYPSTHGGEPNPAPRAPHQ